MKIPSPLRNTLWCTFCAIGLVPFVTSAAPHRSVAAQGTIKSVNPATHTLVVTEEKDKKDHQFEWNDQSKFNLNGKAVAATELKAGDGIRATYQESGDRMIIQSARLAPGTAENSSSKSNAANKRHHRGSV